MKRFSIFKGLRRLVITALILFVAVPSQSIAQTEVLEDGVAADATIIRQYQTDEFIVYHKDDVKSCFSYWDANTSTLTKATFAIYNITIKDFEILDNGYAYFCGKEFSKAIFGYFYVPDLVNGTLSSIDYYYVYPISGYNFDSIRRIEAFYGRADSSIHLVMVGDCEYDPESIPCHFVLEARTANMATPSFTLEAMTYIKNHENYYDVAVSDNYVTTADLIGSQNSGRFYDKPTTFATSIFSTSLYSTSVFKKYYLWVYGTYTPVVKNLVADDFITITPEPNSNIFVSFHNGPAFVTDYVIDVRPYTVTNHATDISVNYPDVYFIQDVVDNANNPLSLFFHLSLSGYTFTAEYMVVSSTGALQSVAAQSPGNINVALSGYTTSSNLELVKFRNVTSCTPRTVPPVSSFPDPDVPDRYDTDIVYPSHYWITTPVGITTVTLSSVCY